MTELYSTEAEKVLLGCMLIDNSIIDNVLTVIKKDSFITSNHQLFFERIIKIYTENQNVDVMMLCESLPQKFTSEICELTEITSSASNYGYYVKKIDSFYKLRKLRVYSKSLYEELTVENMNDYIHKTDDFINSLMRDSGNIKSINGRDMVISTLENIQKRRENMLAFPGYDTGFEKLNQLTGGIQDGNLITIAARTSIGKSAFSDQICFNLASKGVKTVSFALEMTSSEIGERRAGYLTGIPLNKIRVGMVSAPQVQRINDAMSKIFSFGDNLILYSLDSDIDSDVRINELSVIESKIRLHAKEGVKVFFIDHIGLISCNETSGSPTWERISYITQRLKLLANKLKIAIIAVVQLTRDAEGKEPQLNQLRGSGSVEQDSNIVIMIHRERQKADEYFIPTKIKVIKNRNGSCGDIDFKFYPATTKFEEVNNEKENLKQE